MILIGTMQLNKKFIIIFFIGIFSLLISTSFLQKTSSIQKKAIIIGATSGIGRALAKKLSQSGYIVGLTGRRKLLLESLQQELTEKSYIHYMDIKETERSQIILKKLIKKMGKVDLIILNAGVGTMNMWNWNEQKETIMVNVLGFAALAQDSMHYFFQQGQGHLVGISSIAALRGIPGAPIYSASKAFVSNYLEGLRAYAVRNNKNIIVTTIEPGAVDTAMGEPISFWRATSEKAADQIYTAIENKVSHAYITHRWRLIAWLFKLLPDCLFYKLF